MTISFDTDPVDEAVRHALDALNEQRRPTESKHIDLKEEAGRRGPGGTLQEPQRENETAARALASEAACMANTDGGGALIVGVEDGTGRLLGAGLDAEWLRSRIYDLTQRMLTVDVREVRVHGTRLLVVKSPQAIEPIRMNQRITWRVDDRCVEIDASTWHARRMARTRYDWSSLDSTVNVSQVRTIAVEQARAYLQESGESAAADLAAASQSDLLRRLNVVTSEGYLTNAGVIAFVGRDEPALDYIRRDSPGGDSVARVRVGGRSLIEEVAEVERSLARFNGTRHIQRGFVIGQVRDLPPLAAREAIINGAVHRDWASAAPTLVEHTRRTLVVTSPGGFVGGVTPQNIITHPSQPRHRALAELFAALRLAEREGVGVDRMVREMISLGYPAPDIAETPGPHVRTALVGESLDEGWIGFLGDLLPATTRTDLDSLLLLRELVRRGWIDAARAAPVLQRSVTEATSAIERLEGVQIGDSPVVERVKGTPAGTAPAWTLSTQANTALGESYDVAGTARPPVSRAAVAMDWAHARGRVSSTELASIVDAQPSNVGPVLRTLEADGELEPSRSNRRGPGFYYRPVS